MKINLLKNAFFASAMLLSAPAFAQSLSPAAATTIDIPAGSGAVQGLSADQVRAIVREEIQKNPKLIMDSLNSFIAEQQQVKEQDAHRATLSAKADIIADKGYPVSGNQTAKVSIHYYFDVNCGYCKKIEPELTKFMKDNPDVRMVYHEMPILAASSHYAAQINGVFFRNYPEKYAELHVALMGLKAGMSNSEIDQVVIEMLGPEKGSDLIQKALDVDGNPEAKEVAQKVSDTLRTAGKASITGTPFLFVDGGDGIIRGASPNFTADLTQMVNAGRALADQ